MVRQRIPGFCALCRSRCGCISVVEDGKLVAVEPNPEHPTGAALCVKGRGAPELVNSHERLLHPVRRTRPKGASDPGWQTVSWDEALDWTAVEMRRVARKCPSLGLPGYVAVGAGSANYNALIGSGAADPISGSTPLRSYLCEVRSDR